MMLLMLLFVSLARTCGSFKILVVNPKFAYSHMNFMGRVADTLVDAGHEVVTLQPTLSPHFDGTGTTKSRLIQVNSSAELTDIVSEHLMHGAVKKNLWTDNPKNPFDMLAFLPPLKKVVYKAVSDLLDDKKLLHQLKMENFDVAITELFDFVGFGVLEAINIKNIIGVQTIGCVMEPTSVAIGQPVLPSFIPASFGVTDDSCDLWTRTLNLLFTFVSWKFQYDLANVAEQAMIKKLGPSVTPIWLFPCQDTISNMSWLLVNSEPFLDFDRPTLHKIVHIGGLGVREPKALDEQWNRVLTRKPRTVLISFGSVATTNTMPSDIKKTIVDAVRSHPEITFIWKYEQVNDSIMADVENLVLSKWTPQTDLLADDRLTLFVTHGGSGSTMESVTYGKPVIVIPLFGDQIRNAKLIEKFGLGVIVDKANLLHGSVFNESLDLVLNDPKYRLAAQRMKGLLSNRQFTPQQKLIRTVELAAQFGDLEGFKVTGRNLGFIVYYNIDLIIFLCTAILIFISFPIYLIHLTIRKCVLKAKVKTQ